LAMRRDLAITIFWALVLYGFTDTIVAFYQMLGLGNTRPGGLFMDSNARAIYVVTAILFLYTQLITDVSRQRGVLLWSVLFILMVGFHSAQSRAMLALGGLALLILWLYVFFADPTHRKTVIRLSLFSFLGFIVFYGIFQFVPNAGLAMLNKPEGADVRFELWGTVWQLIKERPLVGHGFGLFEYLYPSVRTEWGTGGFFVHNDFLEFWLGSGIPGLVLTLIPVFYFLYKAVEAFWMRRFPQLLFSGIGLCFMGFAFFNYFYWRFENLLVLAAIWRLVELGNENEIAPKSIHVSMKHKFIGLLIVILPAASVLAKVQEESVIVRGGRVVEQMDSWSDVVLGDESHLIPLRARWYLNEAVNGRIEDINYDAFNLLIAQLDAEIARGTLYPTFYCARAEIGYLLGEPYGSVIGYVESGEQRDPLSIYCHYARFNLNIAFDKGELGLLELKVFFSHNLPMDKATTIITLADLGRNYAKSQNSQAYVAFFTQYRAYIEQRMIELGME